MIPDQHVLIRKNLADACHLVPPGAAAINAFRSQLLSMLQGMAGMASAARAEAYLGIILQDTRFAPGTAAYPANSSPVCYANDPDLREGFRAPQGPDNMDPQVRPAALAAKADLKAALQATISAVLLIINALYPSQQVDAAVEKQAAGLAGQLYGLSPEEMAQLAGN
jgi:hypothetical protein